MTIDLAALRMLAEKATPGASLQVNRYDHGGGRAFVPEPRDLVADFYDEANREFYLAASPETVLALLDRLAAASEVVEAARRWHETYWLGTKKTGRDYHEDAGSVRVLVNAYDRAIAGQQQRQEGTT